MTKRVLKLWASGIAGAIIGGTIIIIGLSYLGEKQEEVGILSESLPDRNRPEKPINQTPSPSTEITGTPKPSPSADKTEGPVLSVFEPLGISYKLPGSYRIASEIMEFDASISGGAAILTLTKGTPEQEREYVQLLKSLQKDDAATEAPAFLPGQTISVFKGSENAKKSDESLARSKANLILSNASEATRYAKVEGLFTYDATHMMLMDGSTRIIVQMNYNSEEPYFDEEAYETILASINRI